MAGNFYVKSDFQLIYHISQSFAWAARLPQRCSDSAYKGAGPTWSGESEIGKIQTIYAYWISLSPLFLLQLQAKVGELEQLPVEETPLYRLEAVLNYEKFKKR